MMSNTAEWLGRQPTQNGYANMAASDGQNFEMMAHQSQPPFDLGGNNQIMDVLSTAFNNLHSFLETPRGMKIFAGLFAVGFVVTFLGGSSDGDSLRVNVPLTSNHNDHLFIPHYTRQHILDYPESAQAKGVDYVQSRPDFKDLPLWRREQLLALTTFWFGLHPRPKNHMIAHPHECEWWELDPQCNSEGKYTSLKSDKMAFLSLHAEETGVAHGTIPPQISLLTDLKSLTLANHSLTGTVPTELGKMTRLSNLHLYSNSLIGTIPTELGRLIHMKGLSLGHNALIGTIPRELGFLTVLREFILANNELTGSIPEILGHLSHVQIFELNKNYLDGTFPTELGQMTDTKILALDHNRIKGRVPSELGRLTHLTSLTLQTNDLSGMVPSELGKLSQLTECHFFGNDNIAGHHASPLECMHFNP